MVVEVFTIIMIICVDDELLRCKWSRYDLFHPCSMLGEIRVKEISVNMSFIFEYK
jgi:hypothetical protein